MLDQTFFLKPCEGKMTATVPTKDQFVWDVADNPHDNQGNLGIMTCKSGSNAFVEVLRVSAEEVERRLVNIDGSKGSGLHKITPVGLKHCEAVWAPHFAI